MAISHTERQQKLQLICAVLAVGLMVSGILAFILFAMSRAHPGS